MNTATMTMQNVISDFAIKKLIVKFAFAEKLLIIIMVLLIAVANIATVNACATDTQIAIDAVWVTSAAAWDVSAIAFIAAALLSVNPVGWLTLTGLWANEVAALTALNAAILNLQNDLNNRCCNS